MCSRNLTSADCDHREMSRDTSSSDWLAVTGRRVGWRGDWAARWLGNWAASGNVILEARVGAGLGRLCDWVARWRGDWVAMGLGWLGGYLAGWRGSEGAGVCTAQKYVDSEELRAHPHHSFKLEGDLMIQMDALGVIQLCDGGKYRRSCASTAAEARAIDPSGGKSAAEGGEMEYGTQPGQRADPTTDARIQGEETSVGTQHQGGEDGSEGEGKTPRAPAEMRGAQGKGEVAESRSHGDGEVESARVDDPSQSVPGQKSPKDTAGDAATNDAATNRGAIEATAGIDDASTGTKNAASESDAVEAQGIKEQQALLELKAKLQEESSRLAGATAGKSKRPAELEFDPHRFRKGREGSSRASSTPHARLPVPTPAMSEEERRREAIWQKEEAESLEFEVDPKCLAKGASHPCFKKYLRAKAQWEALKEQTSATR
ncbi:hypothetical protein CYMTET_27040 [Cymbomonas tetramitiformis]|uniref:Uncharacterized protein n=1 Tax=Cymbomonas tetramitiformis TaxID=36881 RepID=A0AAE0FQI9_9CHLO|nr:hypothetical protein CYMTET_27040 [Cymbomonas tetramitiformis]